jgi:hypothetical protein
LRIFLFQVFVDDRGFVDDGVAIHQHGNLTVGISFKELFRLVFEIAFDELVGYLFFRQDKPCPVGVGSGLVGIKFHGLLLFILLVVGETLGVNDRTSMITRADLDALIVDR